MIRSEEMAKCQIYMSNETAYYTLSKLGEAGLVQFIDLNSGEAAHKRQFVPDVRRCDELKRKLKYIRSEIVKFGMEVPTVDEVTTPDPKDVVAFEALLEKKEGEVWELAKNESTLKSNLKRLREYAFVLNQLEIIFSEESDDLPLTIFHGGLGYYAGTIKRVKMQNFEKMLFRITRGNLYMRRADMYEELEEPPPEMRNRVVFVIFYQGAHLKSLIKKVCQGFRAHIYKCPSTVSDRKSLREDIIMNQFDLQMVLEQSKEHRQAQMKILATDIDLWQKQILKVKAIYYTMNSFNLDLSKQCMVGEAWVPVNDLKRVQIAMEEGAELSFSTMPAVINRIKTDETPPTFNRTNRFTKGFQNLINSYGVATYQEANPALYSIITFPFLFAVMFGDIGHGFIMALFGSVLVLKEDKLMKIKSSNEIWRIFFGGRYIIMLMGFFSMYTGIIYNDIFSKSLNVFGSSWRNNFAKREILNSSSLDLEPKSDYSQYPYPFGMDPIWVVADNRIIFFNSYKMKLSIIFGVIHMIFGLSMSVVNHRFFKEYFAIFLEFLPMVVFLSLLFLYLCFLMFYKWFNYSAINTDKKFNEHCAPSVLITFINMLLQSESAVDPGCDSYMFPHQKQMQQIFLVIALLCVPIILFGRPCYVLAKRKKEQKHKIKKRKSLHKILLGCLAGLKKCCRKKKDLPKIKRKSTAVPPASHGDHNEASDSKEEEFSDIMIHQGIHTIEFVLSCVSHTASYLRLWALSLAHGELSHVLYSMVLKHGFKNSFAGIPILYFSFAFWALGTLSILVLMEGLSAFLHTLRLHWVEFMSKFYQGTGEIFHPLDFKELSEDD